MTITRQTLALTLTAALAFGAACGGSDGTDTTGTGGQGAAGAGGPGGSGGTGGGEPACEPGETRACYEGPAGTEDVGLCLGGSETCAEDGSGWGACSDQVLPVDEDCDAVGDEDCDGLACADTSWAMAFEGMGNFIPYDLVTDAQGNTIVLGNASGELIVDGVMVPDPDLIVGKLDPAGAVLWVKSVDGGTSGLSGRAITVDESGFIYVAGWYFNEPINLGDTPATELEAVVGEDELFTAKLDPDGNHVWSRYLSAHQAPGVFGPEGTKGVRDIAVDTQAVYVAGTYNGHFGGVCLNGCTSSQGIDSFIRALDRDDGATIFHRRIGSSANDSIQSIDLAPGGGLYVGGRAGANPLAIGGTGMPVNGNGDPIVLRLDATGNLVWGTSLGGATGQGTTYQVAPTPSGVAVSGIFLNELELAGTHAPPGPAFLAGFVGEFGPDGTPLWGWSYGANDADVFETRVASDGAGNLFLATYFEGAVELDTALYQTVGGAQGAMLTKIDPTGTPQWSRAYLTSSSEHCWIQALSVAPDDHAHILVRAEDAVDMGVPVPFGGDVDGIAARIQP